MVAIYAKRVGFGMLYGVRCLQKKRAALLQ
jgi:hypothetical protein